MSVNLNSKVNTAPSEVQNLSVTNLGYGNIRFDWDESSDDFSNAIGYNLKIGTTQGGSELSNTLSDLESGSIDLCYVSFYSNNVNNYNIIKCETIDYSNDLKIKLINIINFDTQKIKEIDLKFGEFIGLSINKFISKNKLDIPNLISSHGHTVFHQPNIGKTLQIGNGKVINEITEDLTKSTFDDEENDERRKENLKEYINNIGWDLRFAHSLTYLNNKKQRRIGNNSLMFSVKKTDIHPEGAIFARGSCDDKGQMFMHLKAIEVLNNNGGLPCNVKLKKIFCCKD